MKHLVNKGFAGPQSQDTGMAESPIWFTNTSLACQETTGWKHAGRLQTNLPDHWNGTAKRWWCFEVQLRQYVEYVILQTEKHSVALLPRLCKLKRKAPIMPQSQRIDIMFQMRYHFLALDSQPVTHSYVDLCVFIVVFTTLQYFMTY